MPDTIIKKRYTQWDEMVRHQVKTLHCWLNYVKGVGRENIVKEDSIKYGIAEYLSIHCPEFELESWHNVLPHTRHLDLKFYIPLGLNTIENVCEFKQVTESTFTNPEECRYFADLCRLSLYKTNSKVKKIVKTYFLVAGKTLEAYPMLPKPKAKRGRKPLSAPKAPAHITPIPKWLSLDADKPEKTFKLSSQIEFVNFENDYAHDKSEVLKAGKNWLSGGQVMKTRLVAIEGIGEDEGGFLVAAWEVGLKKDLI